MITSLSSLSSLLLLLHLGLTSGHPCLSQAGRDSSVCRQLISLCSSSSPDLPPSCSGLLHLLDSQTEEQRIDLGLAVLEPSIGTTQSTTAQTKSTFLCLSFILFIQKYYLYDCFEII